MGEVMMQKIGGVPRTPFVQINISQRFNVDGGTGGRLQKVYTYNLGSSPTYITIEPNGKNDLWDLNSTTTWVIKSPVKLKNGNSMIVMDHNQTNTSSRYYYGTCKIALSGEVVTLTIDYWHGYQGGSGWYQADTNVNFAITGYF